MSADDQVAPAPAEAAGPERPPNESDGADMDAGGASPTGAQAPAVVVVVVTHEPGPWFTETLESLAAQAYAPLSVLVVASGGIDESGEPDDLERRIAAVLPTAHLRRIEGNPGFSASANESLRAVSGAAFLLFCHDDVALAPDAVQILVEEAYRSNAGVVGPKLVRWDEPTQLLQVGMGADKAGAPSPVVEPGELDQEQHDAVRDVFYVPSAAMLVRADLFEAVGGFDDAIPYHGEDLDLCWRAAVAGARVLVAPGAVVRHREELERRRPELNIRRIQLRHQLRTVLIDYGRFHRMRVLPQLAALATVEFLYALVLGRFRHAVDVASAWTWNVSRREGRRERRRTLRSVRVVPDRDIRPMQARGSARVADWIEERLGSEDGLQAMVAEGSSDESHPLSPSEREPTASDGSTTVGSRAAAGSHRGSLRLVVAVWTAVAAWLLVGARDLIAGGVPVVGTLVPFPSSVGSGVTSWASGFRTAGLGYVGPSSIGTLLMSLSSVPFAGSGSAARSVIILALLPLGALGAWRLARPIGSRRARLVALVVYVAVPVPANALAGGRFGALVVYAATPWVIAQVARAGGIAPFGSRGGMHGPGITDRPFAFRVLALGLLLALMGIAEPAAMGFALVFAAVFAVGGILVGQLKGTGTMIGTVLVSTVVAFVLHLPWSLGLFEWSSVSMSGPLLPPTSSAGRVLGLSEIVRFDTGPFGNSPLGFALLPAASLALLLGKSWRLGWAARGWMLALASWAAVTASTQHWVAVHLPAPEVLLVPAAAGLALAAAMGTAAFEVDLPDYQIGWRQVASVLSVAALFLAMISPLGAAIGGRFGMPEGDFQRSLQNLAADTKAPFRVLWIGDASVLPLRGYSAELPGLGSPGDGRALAFSLSDGGPPTPDNLWIGRDDAGIRQLVNALASAAAGGSRLGQLLGPMGVRYVVVAERLSPGRFANEVNIPQPRLQQVLEGQLDLARVEVAGALVYRNAAWAPSRVVVPGDTAFPDPGVPPSERLLPALAEGAPALTGDPVLVPASGNVPSGVEVYVATPRDPELSLMVDGRAVPSRQVPVLGWATVFDVADGGTGQLQVTSRPILLGFQSGQAAVWLLASLYLLRTRVDRDERRVRRGGPR